MEELYLIKKETLIGIADAIRSKTGSTDLIDVNNFHSTIHNIPTSGYKTITGTINGVTVTDQNNGLWMLELESNSNVCAIAINCLSTIYTHGKTGLITINLQNLTLPDSTYGKYPCSFISETMSGFIQNPIDYNATGSGVSIGFIDGYLHVWPQCGWLDYDYNYTIVYQ